ncbi:maleylpyruvate isomerase N-terminal domain-containing protein [Kitasatospora sp. NPDC088134]|uniref:maleylpyruvate isomerase N-terminal domain-containing protein n=1 Tax=Kitasatospora sp. NPDC088134 TaxID=3364071 RepID=UPI0038087660
MTNSLGVHEASVVRVALAGQVGALRGVVAGLGERELGLPTRLGAWRVRELVAHLDRQIGWTPEHLDDPVPVGLPGLTLAAWVAAVGAFADALDRGTREQAAAYYAGSAAEVAARFAEVCGRLADFLDSPAAARAGRPFPLPFGVIGLGDFLVTRLVETVVHADDLADALGLGAFPHDAGALAAVADLLAASVGEPWRARAVELAAADPVRWLRLATGRERADGTGLDERLPVLS